MIVLESFIAVSIPAFLPPTRLHLSRVGRLRSMTSPALAGTVQLLITAPDPGTFLLRFSSLRRGLDPIVALAEEGLPSTSRLPVITFRPSSLFGIETSLSGMSARLTGRSASTAEQKVEAAGRIASFWLAWKARVSLGPSLCIDSLHLYDALAATIWTSSEQEALPWVRLDRRVFVMILRGPLSDLLRALMCAQHSVKAFKVRPSSFPSIAKPCVFNAHPLVPDRARSEGVRP